MIVPHSNFLRYFGPCTCNSVLHVSGEARTHASVTNYPTVYRKAAIRMDLPYTGRKWLHYAYMYVYFLHERPRREM